MIFWPVAIIINIIAQEGITSTESILEGLTTEYLTDSGLVGP